MTHGGLTKTTSGMLRIVGSGKGKAGYVYVLCGIHAHWYDVRTYIYI